MKSEIYSKISSFIKKYPLTVAFRLGKHCKIIEKHLNSDEQIIYAFPAQKNISPVDIFCTCIVVFTNKRIMVAQKRVLPGYRLSSITPDMFNDFQVYKGFIFGRIDIDTIKEVVQFSNLDPRSLTEVETNLSEYLTKEKPRFIKDMKENNQKVLE